ncbi:MAG: carbohydrate binding family 9 domain-containing protein, partial [Candidatus Latescibacteria bacterium]|nr:carbohydrate binding family 9 domain-containing protein [Candidatus Latescibacterota bacterium]
MKGCKILNPSHENRTRTRLGLFLFIICQLFTSTSPLRAHETLSDDNKGVTAIRLETHQKVNLDGRLNEPIWQITKPATDFIQKELDYGSPAQQDAEVRFCYDERNLYIGIRCFDDQPKTILKPMSRSERDMNAGDVLNLFIDSRHDHRTGYRISVNPSGMRGDEARYNDYLKDNSWDGFWWVETHIDSLGWTAEIKLPFKNFRFETLGAQTWGLNIERRVPRLNEQSYWKKVSLDDGRFTRMSKLGHLTGIHDIKQGRRAEIVPYGLVGTSRADATDPDVTTETGLDIKYAIPSGLTLDATVNPDFAQVDADVDEINLSRFPTRFPELRPFFVEGNNAFLTPIELFYSRRIGGRADILGGGKISGKMGPYTLGLITVQTGDWTYFGIQDDDASKEDATFGILRLKRDIFSKSTIGLVVADKEYGNAYSRV